MVKKKTRKNGNKQTNKQTIRLNIKNKKKENLDLLKEVFRMLMLVIQKELFWFLNENLILGISKVLVSSLK